MKKVFITLIFSMLLLCACSSEKSISGQVIEVIPETESEPVQFIILTDEEEKALIKMDEDSFVMSWVEDVDTEAFKKGMLSVTEDGTGAPVFGDIREIEGVVLS